MTYKYNNNTLSRSWFIIKLDLLTKNVDKLLHLQSLELLYHIANIAIDFLYPTISMKISLPILVLISDDRIHYKVQNKKQNNYISASSLNN